MKTCNIALIGINGFGEIHLDAAKHLEETGMISIKAICESNYDACSSKIEELKGKGVQCYRDYKELIRNEKALDFVIVATPIHLHRSMAVDIMEGGFNVLLEKPPAVTIQDIDAIIDSSARTGKLCSVNFMMTSGKAFLKLRDMVLNGQLGEIKTITGKGLWKRLDNYYERTPWAGKLVFNERYVLDGTINNPLAHLLNNMLLLANAAKPFLIKAVTAELYHAHSIDGEDTSCIRIETDSEIELLYYATLCSKESSMPDIIVEGTKGRAFWNYGNELEIVREGYSSRTKYDEENVFERMYGNLCAVISGEEKQLFCSIADTRNFVLASNGAFESSGKMHAISSEYIARYQEEGSIATYVEDINGIIEQSQNEKKLFSEINVKWAFKGERFMMEGYTEFNMFR